VAARGGAVPGSGTVARGCVVARGGGGGSLGASKLLSMPQISLLCTQLAVLAASSQDRS
jgi:hypothetical protein